MNEVLQLSRTVPPHRSANHERKLRNLGVHTAHVVHELRVPLSLIVGSLQSIEQFVAASADYIQATADQHRTAALPANQPLDSDLEFLAAEAPNLLAICREGVARIDHVLAQLRGYSAVNSLAFGRRVNLAEVIDESVALAAAGRTTGASVDCAVPKQLSVKGDRHALGQVFVNLIANAHDALAAAPDGRISITAHHCTRGRCHGQTRPHLHVIVRDNGPGIVDKLRGRVFEPFCSTKSSGRGLGLGLTIAKQLTESHGGRLNLDPATKSGTAFVVTLPA